MRQRLAAALLGALVAGCATPGASRRPAGAALARDARADFRAFVDSLADAAEFRNAHWGILVVDPESGDTLYSRNAGKLFLPASNQKIITGAVALAHLGPDYRFRTTFAARGAVRGDTLHGDLVVIGRGDPTVSDHMRGDAMQPLREVGDSLRARGVGVVTGRVVAGGDAFPDAPLGYGWAWDDLDAPYAAGVDELMFNEGFSRVRVRAGRAPGDSVRAEIVPATGYPRLAIAAITGDSLAAAAGPRLAASADPDRPGVVVVRGTMRAGDTATVEVAHRDPSAAYLAALRQALAERGVVSLGRLLPLSGSRPARLDTLFTAVSPPLAEIMPALEKPSQNQIAEALLKTLGLERAAVGSADSGRAVVERQLRAWGADTTGFVIRDGSGLSRHDYLSPATIVRVLDEMRRAPSFRVFYDALPVAGVDGTISRRMRDTPAQGNVRAKTGYVDRARSLSGYVTAADGRLLIFSVLCNNWTVPVRAVEQVQDSVAVRLATLHLGHLAAIGGR